MSTNTIFCQSSAEFDWNAFSALYHLNEYRAQIRDQGELGRGRKSPWYHLYTPLGSIDYSMVSRGPFLSIPILGNGFMITVTNIETLSDH